MREQALGGGRSADVAGADEQHREPHSCEVKQTTLDSYAVLPCNVATSTDVNTSTAKPITISAASPRRNVTVSVKATARITQRRAT